MKNLIFFLTLTSMGILMSCFQSTFTTTKDDDILKMIQRGHDIYIKDQIIDQTIDLAKLTEVGDHSYIIRGSLVFVNCVFLKGVQWDNKKGGRWEFDRDVKFINCEFKSDFRANDAIYRGRFLMINCVFHRDMEAQRSTFMNATRITQSKTGNDLILQYSRFLHDLQALDNEVGRNILMQGLSVHGKAQWGNVNCSGGWDLSEAHFHESFSANYAKIGGKLRLSNSIFVGAFSLLNGSIEGPISQNGAHFLTRSSQLLDN